MKRHILSVIRFYRKWISPGLPASCRFYPTCSAYAVEALDRYGALRGCAMAVSRILRCNPWHPGGYDPVPPANNSTKIQIQNSKEKNIFAGPNSESGIRNQKSCLENIDDAEGK